MDCLARERSHDGNIVQPIDRLSNISRPIASAQYMKSLIIRNKIKGVRLFETAN